jgi:4-hydroxy-tetrahydrodipicolinate synthase
MKSQSKFSGVVVPIISPFTPLGDIDSPAVGRVVKYMLDGGVHGIFVLGTTGESASISVAVRLDLMKQMIGAVAGRVPVYAGISGNCFQESLDAARSYAALGAAALVAHVPSYFTLSDAQIEYWFQRLADAVPLPLLLYNIPHTTHHMISLSSIEKLSAHPNIVGIKESARDLARQTELLKRFAGRDNFFVMLGAPPYYSAGLRNGAVGLVPSGANLEPAPFAQIYNAAKKSDWAEVDRLQGVVDGVQNGYQQGRSLGDSLSVLKHFLSRKGICGPTVLPPLLTIDEEG